MEQTKSVIVDPWTFGANDANSTPARNFFEAYATAVGSRTFGDDITQWYGDLSVFRSETGSVFRGAEEIREWMTTLFFSFEKIKHVPENYTEVQTSSNGVVKVFAQLRRMLWMKGNTGEEPDVETPMALIFTVGPAVGGKGYLGLQFRDVTIYWDKTKTVNLLGKRLPSD